MQLTQLTNPKVIVRVLWALGLQLVLWWVSIRSVKTGPGDKVRIRVKTSPSYLRRLISDRDHVHNLRSATTSLSQSSSRTTLAKRAFRCSAPSVWNSLSRTVVDSDSIAVFKFKLKTFLFSQAYCLSSSHSHYLAQRLWSYDLMALYKCLYYYYYYDKKTVWQTTHWPNGLPSEIDNDDKIIIMLITMYTFQFCSKVLSTPVGRPTVWRQK